MKKIIGKARRTLSILLAAAMVLTCAPQAALTASAAQDAPAAAQDVLPGEEAVLETESTPADAAPADADAPAADETAAEVPAVDPAAGEEPSADEAAPVPVPGIAKPQENKAITGDDITVQGNIEKTVLDPDSGITWENDASKEEDTIYFTVAAKPGYKLTNSVVNTVTQEEGKEKQTPLVAVENAKVKNENKEPATPIYSTKEAITITALTTAITQATYTITVPKGMALTSASGAEATFTQNGEDKTKWTLAPGAAKCKFTLAPAKEDGNAIAALTDETRYVLPSNIKYTIEGGSASEEGVTNVAQGGVFATVDIPLTSLNAAEGATVTITLTPPLWKFDLWGSDKQNSYQGESTDHFRVFSVNYADSKYTPDTTNQTGKIETVPTVGDVYFLVVPSKGKNASDKSYQIESVTNEESTVLEAQADYNKDNITGKIYKLTQEQLKTSAKVTVKVSEAPKPTTADRTITLPANVVLTPAESSKAKLTQTNATDWKLAQGATECKFELAAAGGYKFSKDPTFTYKIGNTDNGALTKVKETNFYAITTTDITGNITISLGADVTVVPEKVKITFSNFKDKDTNHYTPALKTAPEEVGSVYTDNADEIEGASFKMPYNKAVGFVVTAETGYRVKEVKINGATAKMTGKTNSEAPADVYELDKDVLKSDATITVTMAKEHTVTFTPDVEGSYTVYPVTLEGDAWKGTSSAGTVKTIGDDDINFVVVPADMYAAPANVSAKQENKPVICTKKYEKDDDSANTVVQAEVSGKGYDIYTIRRASLTGDIVVTITPVIDKKNANKITWTNSQDAGSSSKYTVTVSDKNAVKGTTGDDANTWYTAKTGDITVTVTTEDGYEVTSVLNSSSATADPKEKNDSEWTFTSTFAADAKNTENSYTIKVEPKAVTDTGEVTFAIAENVEGVTLAVTAVDGLTAPTDTPDNTGEYTFTTAVKELTFTVAIDESSLPVVTAKAGEGDPTELNYASVNNNTYTYTVSAFAINDKTITIGKKAKPAEVTKKTLSIWYEADLVDVTVKSGTDAVSPSKKLEDGITTVYSIASNTTVTVIVDAKYGHTVQYCIGNLGMNNGSLDETITLPNNPSWKTTVPVKISSFTTDQYVYIKTSDSKTFFLMDSDGASAAGTGTNNAPYAVSYLPGKNTYTAYVADAASKEIKTGLTGATLTGSGTIKSTVSNDGDTASIVIDPADAGKSWTLRITYSDTTTYTCTLKVANDLTQATVIDVKNGKLTHQADSKKEDYAIRFSDNTLKGNLSLVTDYDWLQEPQKAIVNSKVTVKLSSDKLSVDVKALTKNELATLKLLLETVTYKLKDSTTGKDLSSFKLVVPEPNLAKPTVKVEKSTDVNFTLSLSLSKTQFKGLEAGKLWYKITVTPEVKTGNVKPTKLIDAAKVYYVDAEETSAVIELAKDGKKQGEGEKWKFSVSTELIQSKDKTVNFSEATKEQITAALTNFASQAATVAAETKTPAYATKLTLKKGVATVYTGQTDVVIATIDFGKNTSFTRDDDVDAEDLNEDVPLDLEIVDSKIVVSTKYIVGEDEIISATGKHKIRVTTTPKDAEDAPVDVQPVSAEIIVNVERGIEELSLTAPSNQILVSTSKASTLQFTPEYNKDGEAPKIKKVKDYKLIEVDNNQPKKDDGNDVIYTSAKDRGKDLVTVSTSGKVTVAKGYDKGATSDKFIVRATAADWNGNTVYGYSGVITITKTGIKVNDIVVVKPPTGVGTEYTVVLADKDGKRSATSAQLDGAVVKVLNEAVTQSNPLKGTYVAADFLDDACLSFTSSNKAALSVDTDGNVTAYKAAKNISLTVNANDGSGSKNTLTGLEIKNADIDMLGLSVKIGEKELNPNYADNAISYTGSSGTRLNITVMRQTKDSDSIPAWDDLAEYNDLKVTFTGSKTAISLPKSETTYNQKYAIIPTGDKVTVKLEYKKNGSKYDSTQTFTITNNGFNKDLGTLKITTTPAKLVAGAYDEADEQTISVTAELPDKAVTNGNGKDSYVVLVQSDAADRAKSEANKARYEILEAHEEWENGTVFMSKTVNAGTATKPVYRSSFNLTFNKAEDEDPEIPDGTYKLQFTCGKIDENGVFVPLTKTLPKSITFSKPPVKRGVYKAVSTVKMSLYDNAAGVTLKGTGVKADTTETYKDLKNALNPDGTPNKFMDYFELNGTTKLKLKRSLEDADITKITGSAGAKDRIGYVSYEAIDAATGEKAEGTAKITVQFQTGKKTVDTYSVTNTAILAGTTEATVNVAAKQGRDNVTVSLTAAYVLPPTGSSIALKSASSVAAGSITFDSMGSLAVGSCKPELYIIPANSYYAGKKSDIDTLKSTYDGKSDSADKATALTAYKKALNDYAVKLAPTITVADAVAQANKIKPTNTRLKFTNTYVEDEKTGIKSGYNKEETVFWILVPYTLPYSGTVNEITQDETAAKKGITISADTQIQNEASYIKILLTKAGRDALTGTSVTAKADVTFKQINSKTPKDDSLIFTLTLPKKQQDYAGALDELGSSEQGTFNFSSYINDTIKKAVAGIWGNWTADNVTFPTVSESKYTVENTNGSLYTKLQETFAAIEEIIRVAAPVDTCVLIEMPQQQTEKFEFAESEFKKPGTEDGKLVVKVTLKEAKNSQTVADKQTAATNVTLTLTLPKLKAKPADYTAQLATLVTNFTKTAAEQDWNEIEADARKGFETAVGKTLTELRLWLHVVETSYTEDGSKKTAQKGKFELYALDGDANAKLSEFFTITFGEAQTLDAAKTAVDTAVNTNFKNKGISNDTTAAQILAAARAAVKNPAIKVVWSGTSASKPDGSFELIAASRNADGTIKGTLLVYLGSTKETIELKEGEVGSKTDWKIPKLAKLDDVVAAVKTAVGIDSDNKVIESTLRAFIFNADGTQREKAAVANAILAAADETVEGKGYTVAWNTAITFTKATGTTEGTIAFVIKLTDTTATPNSTQLITLASTKFPLQTLTEAKNAVEEALTAFNKTVTNNTDVNAVKTAAQNAVKVNAITVSIKENSFALTRATGKGGGVLKYIVVMEPPTGSAEAAVEIDHNTKDNVTIAKLTTLAQFVAEAQNELNTHTFTAASDLAVAPTGISLKNAILDKVKAILPDGEAFSAAYDESSKIEATVKQTGKVTVVIKITQTEGNKTDNTAKKEYDSISIAQDANAAADLIDAAVKAMEISNETKDADVKKTIEDLGTKNLLKATYTLAEATPVELTDKTESKWYLPGKVTIKVNWKADGTDKTATITDKVIPAAEDAAKAKEAVIKLINDDTFANDLTDTTFIAKFIGDEQGAKYTLTWSQTEGAEFKKENGEITGTLVIGGTGSNSSDTASIILGTDTNKITYTTQQQ